MWTTQEKDFLIIYSSKPNQIQIFSVIMRDSMLLMDGVKFERVFSLDKNVVTFFAFLNNKSIISV